MNVLKQKLSGLSGGRMLDVATGSGYFLKLLVESFAGFEEAVGIDNYSDPARLQEAAKGFPYSGARFLFMDGEKLAFPDESFDVVSISNSIHHLRNIDKVLYEMYRVVKPGGLYIINEMYNDSQTEHQLTHVYLHHWWADIDSRHGINHFYTFSRQELLDKVSQFAFKSLEVLDYKDLNVDYKDKEELEYLSGIIDSYLNKARDLQDFETLKFQGEKLRKRLNETGIASATQLVVVARK